MDTTGIMIGGAPVSVGDRVVYPNGGICRVKGVETKQIAGQGWKMLMLAREEDGATVMVPEAKVNAIGLRKVATADAIQVLFELFTHSNTDPELDWKVRHRENFEKMAAGGLLDTAQVLKGLHALAQIRPLPTKEREMYDSARHQLVGEIAAALNIPPAVAENNIDYALTPPPGSGRTAPKDEPLDIKALRRSMGGKRVSLLGDEEEEEEEESDLGLGEEKEEGEGEESIEGGKGEDEEEAPAKSAAALKSPKEKKPTAPKPPREKKAIAPQPPPVESAKVAAPVPPMQAEAPKAAPPPVEPPKAPAPVETPKVAAAPLPPPKPPEPRPAVPPPVVEAKPPPPPEPAPKPAAKPAAAKPPPVKAKPVAKAKPAAKAKPVAKAKPAAKSKPAAKASKSASAKKPAKSKGGRK